MLKTDSAFIGHPDSEKPLHNKCARRIVPPGKKYRPRWMQLPLRSYPTIKSTTVQIISAKVNSHNDTSTGRKSVRQGLR
jgi:hypothetical protein